MIGDGIPVGYLLGGLVVGDIGLDTQWPFEMQIVLVQLQQEDDQHKESVNHEECKH